MQDLLAAALDRMSLFFGAPPWIVILTLVFIVVLVVGLGLILRERRGGAGPDWDRDPDSMRDLSPNLRRARMQMIAAAIAMAFILVIAALNLFSD